MTSPTPVIPLLALVTYLAMLALTLPNGTQSRPITSVL
jgi:hypothetical protein